MKRPEAIRASHVLLRAQKDAPADQAKAAKAKAEEVDAKAKKGDDFAALAKEFSQDPGSAQNGGDLGFFSKGQMVPEFEKAAWGLKKGEVSDVVQTDYGFHVIKVTDRRAEGYAPIEEVRPQIKEYLTMQMTQQDLQKLAQTLRAAAKVDITL
jgi:peptidyl-prolyl cis-trans isomerase C